MDSLSLPSISGEGEGALKHACVCLMSSPYLQPTAFTTVHLQCTFWYCFPGNRSTYNYLQLSKSVIQTHILICGTLRSHDLTLCCRGLHNNDHDNYNDHHANNHDSLHQPVVQSSHKQKRGLVASSG